MTALALVLASLVAAEPAPAASSVPAQLEASLLQRRRRAYIVGGVFSGAGLALRALAIAAAHPREFEPNLKIAHVVLLAHSAASQNVGLAMTGRGSELLGELRGLQGRPVRLRAGLGWSLFGAGAAVMVASHFVPRACFTTECAVATSVIGHTAGLLVAGAGLNTATFSLGYRRGARRRVSVAPTTAGSQMGLAVSGRF